jgi:hypothetical protein
MDEHATETIVRALRESLAHNYEISAEDYAKAASVVQVALISRSCEICGVVMVDGGRHAEWHAEQGQPPQ